MATVNFAEPLVIINRHPKMDWLTEKSGNVRLAPSYHVYSYPN